MKQERQKRNKEHRPTSCILHDGVWDLTLRWKRFSFNAAHLRRMKEESFTLRYILNWTDNMKIFPVNVWSFFLWHFSFEYFNSSIKDNICFRVVNVLSMGESEPKHCTWFSKFWSVLHNNLGSQYILANLVVHCLQTTITHRGIATGTIWYDQVINRPGSMTKLFALD